MMRMKENRDMNHIIEFVNQSKQMLIEHGECCLTAATGWGKSAATTAILKHFNEDSLVICPSHSIKDQWITGVMEMSGVYNMSLLTYQYFTRHYMELLDKFKIIIFDEAHHMGSPIWGTAIKMFRDLSTNNPYIFGLTAETFRQSDGTDIAETVFHNHIVSAHNYEEAIKDGILPPATYVYAMYDTTGIEEEFAIKDEDSDTVRDLKGRLTYTLQNRTKISTILKKHAPKGCKGIIFVDDIMSVPIGFNLALEAFPNKPIRYIHSGLPKSEVDHTLEDFRKMKSGFIIAIDMLNEGVHVDGVNTVVMLRKTWSRRIYKQQIGRALSPKSKDVTIFDFVANYVSVAEAAQHIADFGTFEGDGNGKGFDRNYSRQSIVHDYVSDILGILEDINNLYKNVKEWTNDEDQILIANYPKIGINVVKLLTDRTPVACKRRASILGLKRIDYNWTPEEDKIIIDNYPKIGREVYKLLNGRSKNSCKHRAKILGVAYIDIASWTPEEDKIIIDNYPEIGGEVYKLLPGRTKDSCYVRARELNVSFNNSKSRWTPEEDKIIIDNYPEIGGEVYKLLPGRTKGSCISRAIRLNIKYTNNQWTEEEDAILREKYPVIGKMCSKFISNKNENQCIHRARVLGLKAATKNNTVWTREEDMVLKENYPSMGNSVYQIIPGKTKDDCSSRATKLGVKSDRIWTKAEDSIIIKNYPTMGSMVVKLLKNRSISACTNRAHKLGVKRIR